MNTVVVEKITSCVAVDSQLFASTALPRAAHVACFVQGHVGCTVDTADDYLMVSTKSRGSDQTDISRLYLIVKIYHSGRKPSKHCQ